MHFVGRTGLFVPVTEESGGGQLYRVKDDKRYAVTATKDYLWIEAHVYETMKDEHKLEIDESYFEKLAYDAIKAIEQFGSFEEFVK